MRSAYRPISWLVLGGGGLLALAATEPTAKAQSTTSQVDLHQYQPSPFSQRDFRLDRTGVQPGGEFRLGLDLDYGFRPLVLVDAMPGIFQAGAAGPEHHLIEHAVNASLAASLGIGHGLELALALPLTLYQAGEAVPGVTPPSSLGVGNPRIGVKARLFARGGFGAGAAILLAPPVGLGSLTYEKGFEGAARLFADYQRGRFAVGAGIGLRVRERVDFYDLALRNQLEFAAGASFDLRPRTTLLAEVSGVTSATAPLGDRHESPAEALAGVRQRIKKNWFTLAAGPGLTDGYGSPIFRVVAGWTWASRPPDLDGDGIPDDDDQCPTVPEDRDGFEDTDGCPDPDNDRDGITDPRDKCPDAAEDRDGFEDEDGCPDPDNDHDGIPDDKDKCRDKPETVNGFEDDDGCPDEAPAAAADTDTDKDGIIDEDDECPEEAEDKDGFEDADGCPDPDNDKDGILDADDKCPLEPETINGIDDADGCPDKGQPEVRLGAHEIETLKPIFFATDRSRVRHAFYKMLEQIASVMKAHPEIGRVAVEGHTDDTGPGDWNQRLSMRRAESVVEFLFRQGIERERLVPVGHAEKLPWSSNETPWGRARNRRVVFHIEGANPAEAKRQEERKERRRHMQRARPASESKGDEPDRNRQAGEQSGTGGQAAPTIHDAPGKGGESAGKKPPPIKPDEKRGEVGTEDAPGEPGKKEPVVGARPASPGKSAADPPRARNRDPGAVLDDSGSAQRGESGQISKDEDQAGDAPEGPGDESRSRKLAGRPRRPAPAAPARSPSKPLFDGATPTLRELLVLPPK